MLKIRNIATWSVSALMMILASLPAGTASAQNTLQWIGEFSVMDLSEDGTVATGLTFDGLYDAVRWTEATGVVNLGMSSGTVLGRGGGLAGISGDGQRIGYTIITPDSLSVTAGRWTKGFGWQALMPPTPPGGGLLDEQYGSCWGISKDGETVVGLFWRPGATDGSAHAFSWTEAGGIVDLGSQGSASRANGCNLDGSVVVGWSSDPTGAWQPTVWENGTLSLLSVPDRSCEARAVTDDGNIIVGKDYNEASGHIEAAAWTRVDSTWQVTHLGVLPGTLIQFGQAVAMNVNNYGTVIVGLNRFAGMNFGGFVWTFEQGLVKASDYLTSLGIALPAGFNIQSMSAITGDGRYMAGYGAYNDTPGVRESFIVHIPNPAPVPDTIPTAGMEIGPCYPNPFNPTTSIALTLDKASDIRMDVFDARGRFVRTLHDGELSAGSHEMVWNGRSEDGRTVGSGVYLARATSGSGVVKTVRMTMIK